MAEVLTADQLKALTEHKYSSEGVSITEPAMQVFWRWLVTKIPMWWAPNAITLSGLVINIFSTIVLIYYSPDAKQEPPRWALFLAILGLFVYQTLDAIDGKQARRTGSSSPLGELFDHGCDSCSTAFVVLGVCLATKLGTNTTIMLVECLAGMFMFYLAHWQTYVSGALQFGKVDVTEAQFGVMGVYLISAIFGSSLWDIPLPIIQEFRYVPIIASMITAIVASYSYFYVILVEGGKGKNGATIAGTSVLTPVVPIFLVVFLAACIWLRSPSLLYETHPCLYIITFGLVVSKITNRLVIAHMTKSEIDWLDSIMIGPLLLIVNQYFNCFFAEYHVLWMSFIYCLFDILRFSVIVCKQICEYLNIYCFVIAVPNSPSKVATMRRPFDKRSRVSTSALPQSQQSMGSLIKEN